MLENILNQLPKIDEKSRNFILGGVLILIFILDYFLVMGPQLNTLRALNPKISALSSDIKTAKEGMAKINQYRQDIAKLNEKQEKANRRVITKEEVNWVLDSISRIAIDERVKIDQIMPLKGSETVLLSNKEGKYYSFPIMVNARCGYHELGKFLNKIEHGDVFLSVNDLNFAASGDGTDRHIAKLTFKTVVFEKAEAQEGK